MIADRARPRCISLLGEPSADPCDRLSRRFHGAGPLHAQLPVN